MSGSERPDVRRDDNAKTVLVVEDNDLNMRLLEALLERSPFEMLQARDGETGVEMARAHRPDLILMDIQLPGIDGLTATRMIREDEELRSIPIVAVTAFAMDADEAAAREAGCAGYIRKPIDTRTFLNTISKFLSGGGDGSER